MAWGVLAAAAAAAIAGLITQNKQNKENRKLTEFQHTANMQSLARQNEYNAPKSQMQRFQDAGLNPHLIYGQGSPGNQTSTPSHPDFKPTDYSALMNIVPTINQTRMIDSQVQAQNATTMQKTALASVNKIQAQVLAKNPLLNEDSYRAIIDSLIYTAEQKGHESAILNTKKLVQEGTREAQINIVHKEFELLVQKFKLNDLDAKVKAEVINSKQFQNEILEVQKRFMVNSEVTPQHILEFIKLLLMKSL